MTDAVLISAGDVIEVQLTSETLVVERGREDPRGERARAEPQPAGRITNRMRVFLREEDGKDRHYDLESARVGVHDGQRVAVVRVRLPRLETPLNVMLVNFSTDERDLFENNIAAHLKRKPFFSPFWKGLGLALIMFAIFFLISHFIVRNGQQPVMSAFLAGFFSFLAFPVFWWAASVWDNVTGRLRYARDRKAFIADIEGRLRAYAPKGA